MFKSSVHARIYCLPTYLVAKSDTYMYISD